MLEKFVSKHDKKIHRFLEIVPGFLTWSFLLSPIWLGLIFPELLVYVIICLTVYWAYMATRHSFGMYKGYRAYSQEMATDWASKCYELDFSTLPDSATLPTKLGDVRHFILIPAVNEPYDVLKQKTPG